MTVDPDLTMIGAAFAAATLTVLTINCSSCAEEIPAASRFCPACGLAIGSPSQMATAAAQKPPMALSSKRQISSSSIPAGGFTPGTILLDRYRIIGLLGRGGMGEVYRADDLKLSQPVALKFLPAALGSDPVRRERFFAEVRISRQLSHPNICRVFDIADYEGRHFLSMEYIDGEDLASLVKRIGHLPDKKALDIARQLAAGLSAAHERGVLHRDLKPANVMLDGRGRVRITDFGLAIAVEDEAQATDASGTPAYMAPEQLAGKGATVRSDIYSLGMILYEIYSGKRAFAAKTVPELREQKEGRPPTAPSDLRAGVDPVVERLIMRCLEREPLARPPSAAQVAAALPGGDPLAAAIAAGETPSPEMLIASGSKEGLRPAVAVGLFAWVIVGALAFAALNDRVGIVQRAALTKSPEALAERARQFLEKIGYSAGASDFASGFYLDPGVLRYIEDADKSATRFNSLADSGTVGFFYRQSPRPLMDSSPIAGIGPADPPLQVPGEVEIRLDGQGRLRTLEAVPPRTASLDASASTPDWTILFVEAGLDRAAWTPTPSQSTPLFYADARAAWSGSLPPSTVPVRIEAAAFGGRPVSFEIVGPWTPSSPELTFATGPFLPTGATGATLALTSVALAAIGLFFARTNLRLGRGDRRSAMRLVASVLAFGGIAWTFVEHHVADLGEGWLFIIGVGMYVSFAAVLWVFYIAIEPFVRRRWPQILVSWTRLLSEDWHDPRVGRDVLVGCAVGVAFACLFGLSRLVPAWFGYPQPEPSIPDWNMLSSARSFIAALSGLVVSALLLSLWWLFVLFFIRVVLRRNWAAAVVFVLVFSASFLAQTAAVWLNVPLVFATSVLMLFVTMRGLVALVLSELVFLLFISSPMTLQTSSWYAWIGYVIFLVVMGLSLYGFRTAVGGRPLLATAGLGD